MIGAKVARAENVVRKLERLEDGTAISEQHAHINADIANLGGCQKKPWKTPRVITARAEQSAAKATPTAEASAGNSANHIS
jgi:hypothetical protein